MAAGRCSGFFHGSSSSGSRRERGDLAAGLARVVLIDSGQHQHRRAEGPHLVPGHDDGETGSPYIAVANASISSLPRSSRSPASRSPHCFQMPSNSSRLLSMIPTGCSRIGRDDSFRRDLAQLQDERAADAAAEHQEPADAEIIHDRQLVGRVSAPRVTGLQRASGLAVIGAGPSRSSCTARHTRSAG